jgi:hypothetical protein
MDINCPYCDAELEINHDDGFGYEEDVKHQMDCDECEKSFVFTTSISFFFDAEKADCLNGKGHNYKLTCTAPKEFSKMRCTDCDDERELTKTEREKFNIGTRMSYFENINNLIK